MNISLNDRKTKILEAIITDYIADALPIGSRTIAKKYNLGISSATIRNEMSDLEEMGLVVQPHASSGRIPSDKGYRLYVDKLMQNRALTGEEAETLRRAIIGNINQIDYLMKETANAIALLTKYTTVVTKNKPEDSAAGSIKHIQLIPVDASSIALVVVLGDSTVKNKTVRVMNAPGYETLLKLTNALNANLFGISADKLKKETLKNIEKGFDGYADVFNPVMENIMLLLNEDIDANIYTSGMKNILSYPEFADIGKAYALFQTLEERDMLITLLGEGRDGDIQIIIGEENNLSHMRDCSVIKTNYRINGHSSGSIGIIGPTRMDYPHVVSTLAAILENIKSVVSALNSS